MESKGFTTQIAEIESIKYLSKSLQRRKKKGLMKAALRLERRISNRVNDIHKKTAKFLCDNCDTVIIPEFQSGRMSKK